MLNLKSLPDSIRKRNAGVLAEIKQMPKTEAIGLIFIKETLREAGIEFVTEYQFAKPRKFRFDIAVGGWLGIEYEGLVATGKKGGHQTKGGYTNNCTKYNLAAQMGWTLLRYTSRNYKQFQHDLKNIMKL